MHWTTIFWKNANSQLKYFNSNSVTYYIALIENTKYVHFLIDERNLRQLDYIAYGLYNEFRNSSDK